MEVKIKRPVLYNDNDLLEIQNSWTFRKDLENEGVTRNQVIGLVIGTQTFITMLESGASVSGIKSREDRTYIIQKLQEGLDIVEDHYPNILSEAENERLYNHAISVITDF